VDQDKKQDPISEERFFPENVQRDNSEKDIPEKDAPISHKGRRKNVPKKAAPIRGTSGRNGGQNLRLWGMLLLLAGFALPLLLLFLFKWPHPGQHLLIFGISYYKLLFIYFLTAALFIHASLFLLKARPLVVLLFFGLSIFCCFPFVLGLKNDLTLYQVISGIPFFYDWPFFLNPSYVMIEFLLPAGVLIYLSLQIKNVFTRGARSYVFLFVAVYLSIATLLGLFGLNEAKLPNIATALTGIRDYVANRAPNPPFDGNVLRKPVLAREAAPELQNHTKYKAPPPGTYGHDTQESAGDLAGVSKTIQQLVEKVGFLEAEIREMRTLLPEKQTAPREEEPPPEREETATNEIPPEQTAILDLEGRIHLLSEEVSVLSDTVKKMTPLLSPAVEQPDKKVPLSEETKVEKKDSNARAMVTQ
jgi:hypothetical protein